MENGEKGEISTVLGGTNIISEMGERKKLIFWIIYTPVFREKR